MAFAVVHGNFRHKLAFERCQRFGPTFPPLSLLMEATLTLFKSICAAVRSMASVDYLGDG